MLTLSLAAFAIAWPAAYVPGQSFTNMLPIPPPMTGTTFTLDVETATHNFSPGSGDSIDVALPTLTYNDPSNPVLDYLGPTMFWQVGSTVSMNVQNNLVNQTTSHWHGVNLPPEDDGGPHEVILPGGNFTPSFPVIENPSTCWYHSHIMDSTLVQVNLGLAGMIIIQDTVNDPFYNLLPHTYGTNDLPIVLQEKGFNFTNSLATGINITDSVDGTGHHYYPGNGPTTVVNGLVTPYYVVPQEVVRLRFLNGSYRKTFRLGMTTVLSNPTPGDFDPMYLIATDGGYTASPMPMNSITMGPGERMEMLFDFSGYTAGETLYVANQSSTMPNYLLGHGTAVGAGTPGNAFMAFIVDNNTTPGNSIPNMSAVPSALVPYSVDTSNVGTIRVKVLQDSAAGGGNNGGQWTIDGIIFNMDTINDIVEVNSREMWRIANTTNLAHPFHIHKIQFQVARIDSNGSPITIPDHLMGFKDDVMVLPGWTLSFVANFDSFPGMLDPMDGFMYHCHILMHEDNGMMHQFVVVDPGAMNADPAQYDPFTFFPNPTHDVLWMKGITTKAGTLRLIDLTGRVLLERQVGPFSGSIHIDVGNLPRGVILAEFSSSQGRSIDRVVLH